jgi:hypothetical protein
MAKEDAEVKSGGPGMAASVAIATAIIGAVTTISVAYINKSDAPEKPRNDSEIIDNKGLPSPPDAVEPPKDVQSFAAPVVANIAGVWRAQDGEEMEIGQMGRRLTFSTMTMTEAGPIAAQGVGKIDDRLVSWDMQLWVQGNQVEADCSGRLTTSGRSLQGTCDLMGQKVPFIYNR